ncbi:unnamed protein product [Dicrocoelium dendriticum]|nr:unnamed protein product [Dicrocoelium dendriticum]
MQKQPKQNKHPPPPEPNTANHVQGTPPTCVSGGGGATGRSTGPQGRAPTRTKHASSNSGGRKLLQTREHKGGRGGIKHAHITTHRHRSATKTSAYSSTQKKKTRQRAQRSQAQNYKNKHPCRQRQQPVVSGGAGTRRGGSTPSGNAQGRAWGKGGNKKRPWRTSAWGCNKSQAGGGPTNTQSGSGGGAPVSGGGGAGGGRAASTTTKHRPPWCKIGGGGGAAAQNGHKSTSSLPNPLLVWCGRRARGVVGGGGFQVVGLNAIT